MQTKTRQRNHQTVLERTDGDPIRVACRFSKLELVDSIKPNPKNPNRHGIEQIEVYADTIIKNGFRRPLVVSKGSGLLVRGHGALMAARHIGLLKVPVEFQDYASQDEELADMIADNELARLADNDRKAMAALLASVEQAQLSELSFGLMQEDLAKLLALGSATVPQGEPPGGVPAFVPPTSHVRMVQLFFTTETHPAFMDKIKVIAEAYATANITEAVTAAVEMCHAEVVKKSANKP